MGRSPDVPRRGLAGRSFRNPSPWVYVLFLPPFVGLLYPPFYARSEPTLGGVPFFIWYQFAWVIVTSALTATVFKLRTGMPFFGRETGTAAEPSTGETHKAAGPRTGVGAEPHEGDRP